MKHDYFAKMHVHICSSPNFDHVTPHVSFVLCGHRSGRRGSLSDSGEVIEEGRAKVQAAMAAAAESGEEVTPLRPLRDRS